MLKRVGPEGFEPSTDRCLIDRIMSRSLWAEHSTQLSYGPFFSGRHEVKTSCYLLFARLSSGGGKSSKSSHSAGRYNRCESDCANLKKPICYEFLISTPQRMMVLFRGPRFIFIRCAFNQPVLPSGHAIVYY